MSVSFAAILPLCAAFAPAQPVLHRTTSAAAQRSAVALSATADGATRGSLLKVVHQVSDLEAVASFYTGAFGLKVLPTESADGRARNLLASGGASPQVELVHTEGGAFADGAGYRGISMRVPNVTDAVAAAMTHGGSVLEDTENVKHGPSNVPEEDDEVITPVVEAVVADPSGFPVHLYEAECAEGVICGVRFDVYEWKKSSEWYESELGWKTLRFQSDVPRKARLALLMGEPGAEGVVGPVGAASDEQPSPLLTLRYVYGCAEREGKSGLEALVLAGGDGGAAELHDPDANPIVLL